jgi:hypothetical protein
MICLSTLFHIAACSQNKEMCAALVYGRLGVLALGFTHRGHRSVQRLEFRKAKQFCFQHSKYDPKLQENVFLGYPEQTVAFVKIAVENADLADVPDTPQGLVLADNHCRGAFQ